jgi:O-antigen/teichoic acid export membrane protein
VGIGRGLLLSAGILIPCTLLAAVMRGGLQGTKKFIALGGGLVGESLIKVCVATFFVAGGYAVGGAWAGVIIAGIISVPLAYFCLPFRKAPLRQVKIDSPFKKALVTLIVMCCVVGFYSFDLLIARMLFSEEVAGNYALAALLGKIILWGTMPIGRAYLPLATEANAQKKKTLLLKASIGSGILSLGILGAYSLFPEQIVTFFSGKQLVIAQELLFKTGLAMSILTFVNLYFMYFLAKLNEQEVTLKNKKISFMILAIVLGLTTECLLLFTARTPEIFSTNLVISALAVSIYTLTAHQFAK